MHQDLWAIYLFLVKELFQRTIVLMTSFFDNAFSVDKEGVLVFKTVNLAISESLWFVCYSKIFPSGSRQILILVQSFFSFCILLLADSTHSCALYLHSKVIWVWGSNRSMSSGCFSPCSPCSSCVCRIA